MLVYLIQYKERGLELFKTAISLPGISLNWAFDTIPKEQKFHLFPPRHADMGNIMRNNLTGGPSIIFYCRQVKGETPICHNNEQIVHSIAGYDANALHLWCTAQNMPMGQLRAYRRDSESEQLALAFEPDVSGKQNAWLSELVCKFPTCVMQSKTVNNALDQKN